MVSSGFMVQASGFGVRESLGSRVSGGGGLGVTFRVEGSGEDGLGV